MRDRCVFVRVHGEVLNNKRVKVRLGMRHIWDVDAFGFFFLILNAFFSSVASI